MASPIRKVALLAGSGRLGPYILKALKSNYDLTVITRKGSTASFPTDINIAHVSDGYPYDEILPIFQKQDAVVFCLGFSGYQYEVPLIKATIDAGVKRTILNAFGGNDANEKARKLFPLASMKGKVLDATKVLAKTAPSSWSWTSIATGLFFDLVFTTSMGGGSFYGLKLEARTASIMGDGNFKFSATNVSTIGEAVSRVLAKPEGTANRSVFVSSFEVSLHDILAAYKKATGTDDWSVTYVEIDETVRNAQEQLKSGPNMSAVGTLGLAVELMEECDPNFASLGLLDNDLLGIPRESPEQSVDRVVKNGLKL